MNSQELRNLQEAYFNVYQKIDQNLIQSQEIYEQEQRQGSLLTRRGTSQNFTGGRSPFTVTEPIQQGRRSPLLLTSPPPTQSQGQLNIPGTSQRSIDAGIWSRTRPFSSQPDLPKERQSPKPAWEGNPPPKPKKPTTPGIKDPFGRGSSSPPTPPNPPTKPTTPPTPPTSQSTSTGGAPGPRPGQTIRATGPTGNFPQLNRFVNNQSSQQMQAVSKLSTLARAGRGGMLGLLLEPTPTSSTDTPGTAPGVSRYNTKDPSGRIRNRLVVGPGKVGQGKVGSVSQSFDKEYAKQKSAGAKEFSFKGKQYTTDSYDMFDLVLSHLITEGYADTNESALVIMTNMSKEWAQSIIEQQTDPLKTAAEMSSLRNTAFGSKKFQEKIWLSPSNPKGPNWDPKSVKTPGV